MLHFAQWKIVSIAFVAVLGILLTIPNFVSREDPAWWPDALPSSRMTLGLDLQGGSHLLFEVDQAALVGEISNDLREQIRSELREDRIRYVDLEALPQGARVTIRDDEQVAAAQAILDEVLGANTSQSFSLGAVAPDVTLAQDSNTFTLSLTEDGLARRLGAAVDQSIEVIRRRIDELGTTEPSIQRQGLDTILVQVPGLDDPQRLKDLIGSTAKMTFQLVDVSTTAAQAGDRPPVGTDILPSVDPAESAYVVEQRIMVSGEDLVDAQQGYDAQTGEPVVNFRFNASGGRRFGEATRQNVGRPFAIVLDNQVISAPVIQTAILGGSGQISGNFTAPEANDLAVLLRSGALPAPLNILEERTVGPGLGADSVAAGSTAAIIGALGVLFFMVLAYGLFGVFANIALVVNVCLIIATLSVLGATLTLPGIAGIVLTIGMAVDSNVLIFERIREEVRNGRQAISAIDVGFSRALGTIVDANITTLIAAVVLFFLGSGPVRGFSVTLAIGILTTVFTAYTVTRLLVALWVRRSRPRTVPI